MDRSTGVKCPECDAEVVYNGNYFCSSCKWVMAEGDKNLCTYLQGLHDKALEAGDTRYAAHCRYYLDLRA